MKINKKNALRLWEERYGDAQYAAACMGSTCFTDASCRFPARLGVPERVFYLCTPAILTDFALSHKKRAICP